MKGEVMLKHRLSQFTISMVLGSIHSAALAQAPMGPLTADHPIVIEHLIHLHGELAKQIAASNSGGSEDSDVRRNALMHLLGVSAVGYQRVTSVLSTAGVQLEAVRSSESQYLSGLPDGRRPGSSAP